MTANASSNGAAPTALQPLPAGVSATLVRQPCFGAASRNPLRPCANPRLNLAVTPAPQIARSVPNTPCRLIRESPAVCEFGAPAGRAQATIALVGDSHAGHWRGALVDVALAHDWRGLSITHTSCPLSKAVRRLPTPARFRACAAWKNEVFAWFARHPEVHTVFVSGLSGGMGVYPSDGRSQFQTSVAGYIAAWSALPATVAHIIVIRDTPKMLADTNACVAVAVSARRPPGSACAVARSAVLDPDPLVAAARRLHSPRVQVIDMTHFFCGARLCYPVIGGALVLRDVTHMTSVYSTTLGPYLLGAVGALMASWKS
ncbi:MAG TPA: SGNH hydrolase domain-containing protein [Solirubrobacteraceae bacterium]|nr:SGNH hydrolase domain-containing protein [Solirubrobacteraceae bacterium]